MMTRNLTRAMLALLLASATHSTAFAQLGTPVEQVRFVEDPLPLRGWVNAEYLLWWMRGQSTGPIVTANNTATVRPFLANQDTVILFGDERVQQRGASGARFTIGTWINGESTTGIEFSAFYLQPRHTNFLASSDANGVPYMGYAFPLSIGGEGILDVSQPGVSIGSVAVSTSSRLLGAELNGVFNAWRMQHDVLELVCGLRYLDLQETLQMTYTSAPLGFAGNVVGIDSFNTRNHFYGAQVGARWTGGVGRVSVGVAGLIALGATSQAIGVDGSTTVTGNTPFAGTAPGFVYSQPSNIGQHSHTSFSAVPQLQVKVGYNAFNNMRFTFGYDLLCWTGVARPGDQLDAVNLTKLNPVFQLEGPPVTDNSARPAPVSNTSTFWAQGISAGIEFSW